MFRGLTKGKLDEYVRPVACISVNGRRIKNWISFYVDINGLGAVDSYEVTLPWEVSDNPEDELLFSGSVDSSELVVGSAVVRIEVGFDGEDMKLLIEGDMDRPVWNFDLSEGEIVTISGRSYASRPYDFSETVKYQNMTSTEAHATIAGLYGLTPVAPVRTSRMVGEYINEDHTSVTLDTSHWDYVLYMAENEGFISRVRGTEWYFGPRDMLPNFNREPLEYSWGKYI